MKHLPSVTRRCGILVAISLILSAFGIPSSLTAQGSPSKGKTIIVLDASGSMWGKVPGGVKIDIAKDTVARLVPSIDPEIELGLMAYGHRKKGDCSDIELLVPPGMGNRDAILAKTRGLVPTGKTPLCDAVLMAADALKYEENKSTVILVSDGIETCGKDPAAVGDLLAAKGIDFVCHVVAFDIDKDKNAGLDALSSKTGGLYLEAKDAGSLWEALNEAMQAAVEPETALILAGRNGAGELLDGVRFEVYGGKESETPSYSGMGGKYRVSLEPGEYQVVGSFGTNRAEGTITIPEGETTNFELSFEATGLTARGALTSDGPILEKGLSWKVFTDPPSKGDRKAIAFSYQAKPEFQLAPGTYYLAGAYQESRAEVTVEVEEGKGGDVKVVFGSGTLLAQARMSEGDPPIERGMSWKLYPAEADSEGDRRLVAFNYQARSEMVVPAGKYLLRATHGQSATQKEVEVFGGKNTEVTLTFGSGTVVTHAVMADGEEFAKGDLSWKLLSAPDDEGKRKRAAFGYGHSETFKVPSGEYLLTVTRGSAGAEREIVVSAGETVEVTLNLNAGIWTGEVFMSASAVEPVTADVAWKVLSLPDEEGKQQQVAFSYGKARYYLPAGTYLARVRRGAAQTEQEISITPAEVKTDRLVLDAGEVTLKGNPENSGPKITIFPAEDENARQVAFQYRNESTFVLPAGRYVATYSYKNGEETKSAKTPFGVEAGQSIDVPLK